MSKDPYRGPTPTRPKQRAIEPCVHDADVPTKVRCPTCLGLGMITAEDYAALEADAKRRDDNR